MANLGTKIVQDIKNRFGSGEFAEKVGSKTGEIIELSIEQQTQKAQDPSGNDFLDLSNNPVADDPNTGQPISYRAWKARYVGTSEANLASGKEFPSAKPKREAFDNLQYNADGNSIDFDFGGYGEAEEYMGEHQMGSSKMPQRRWFPESGGGPDATGQEDDKSQPQQRNADEVAEVLEKFFNEDRTIKVKLEVR